MTERDVFLQAIDVDDPAERAALLDRLSDAELRRRVEILIKAHDEAGGFLREPHPAADAVDHTRAYDSPLLPEEKVGVVIAGRYKLLERIGEGGMGAVWMADQLEPVKRRVAVKLIRTERAGSATILSRFEAERQAIALMNHPNIARLLDAGTTGDMGRPYFVMELVKGVPLTEFCDQHRLSVADRLKLFVQICSAVQHAHQKGIIHRDLKPTNILVESHDDKPVPKVIDFGLAKAMSGQPLTERTLFTGFGTVAGTPLYMAPEQAKFNAVDVDTRADVYALGVILYELLTGSTPIERATFKQAAFDEMLRVIRESEPPTPSKRLSSTQAAPSVAANRQTEPIRLGRLVKGDLDWIVMKALAKERDRRYETANGFAKDVERFLNQEAVSAGPPSAGYKLRKFVQRNRGPVVAAGLVLLALIAGVAGTTFGLVRAEHQRRLAIQAAEAERAAKLDAEQQKENAIRSAEQEAEQRQKAEKARGEAQAKEAEANAVVNFFEYKVFAAARPKGQDGGLGAGVILRDAIAASEPALDKGFTQQPLVEARLRVALGTTFHFLAEPDQSRIQYERARVLYTQNRGPDHPNTLTTMNNLALSYIALNRRTEALKVQEEVLAIQKRVLPPDHPDALSSMNNLASSYAALNRPTEALKLREEVLAIRKLMLPPDHPDTLMSMNNLANSYAALNRPTEALKLYEEVLAIRKRVSPPDHPDMLTGVNNLANSYAALNRPTEALKLYEEVLAIQRRVLPPDHPDTLSSMNNLAGGYAALNRRTEALKLQEEVLAIRRRVLPKDHPDTLSSMNNLSNSYAALNRQTESLKLREEVLAIRKRVLPPGHPETLKSMMNLARSYADLNRHGEALPFLDEFLAQATRPGVDPRLVKFAIGLRLQCCQKANDPAGCRTSAEMWENLNRPDAGSLYNAACSRAVTAAVQAKTPGADAARLAKEDADKAMIWLTKAVAAGWKDAAHIKEDSDLDLLRDREDFKKLMAALEVKAAPTKDSGALKSAAKK